ncbi:MAG: flagellar motor protein MotB [Chitinophagales bacterium]|nr:flagellar motor protein MotB [Chitinophagales bacterium]
MKMRFLIIFGCIALTLASCVSTKKFKAQVSRYDTLQSNYNRVEDQLRTCLTESEANAKKKAEVEEQVTELKKNSTTMLNQLTDLSVVTAQQAESIKKSLDNLGMKDLYIQNLQTQMAKKDSLNMALVMNLKGALQDVNDTDVQIKVEGSAVLISISDKMLFKTGKYDITPEAKQVLGKVARVLNAQPNVQFMVEGNTDNKPIKTPFIKDNWDLSVLRSSSVARSLQNDYHVDPSRIIAAGRGEYHPLSSNDTESGRQTNRRTSIIILPQLDQFFKLLETKK